MLILKILGVWFGLSIPASLFIGQLIRIGQDDNYGQDNAEVCHIDKCTETVRP